MSSKSRDYEKSLRPNNSASRLLSFEVQPHYEGGLIDSSLFESGFLIGVSASFDQCPLDSFSFPERTVVKQDQIDFCIAQFKNMVPQLVQLSQSPFIHCSSYESMPPVVYQDLLGVSALYCHKSNQNKTTIFSMLDSRVSTLITSSKSSSWSIQDYLVGIQALIIYQIIRLFDGDIRQRANAERHMNILEAWTMHLNSTSNIYSNDCNGESNYQRWIFIESVRRTILMSTMIQAMYSLTKDGYCIGIPLMTTLPLSLDGELWNLPEESWWERVNGQGGNLITYGEFINQWSGGETLYTDTFETILIAACRHNIRRPPMMAI